jgi:hypothetical protein
VWRAWLAGLVVVSSGCGHSGPDEVPTPDAPSDGAIPPDGPQFALTTIIVYDSGGLMPLAGTTVHFVAPDLTINVVQTDIEGVAHSSVPPGSTAIVFQEDGIGPLVKVFAGTSPGDIIISGRRRPEAFPALGDVTFQLPSFPNAQGYRLDLSCANPASSTTPQITVQPLMCPEIHTATAVAWATDINGAPISGPSVFRNFNLAGFAGSQAQMPSYDASQAFTMTSSFTNVPANATEATWTERFFVGTNVLTSEASATLPATQLPMFAVVDWGISSLSYRPAGFGVVRVDQTETSGVSSPFAFDANAMIRGIRNGSYNAATDSIRWEEDTLGQPAVLVNALLRLNLTNRHLDIELHAPRDPSLAIKLPPLPPEVSLGPTDVVIVDLIAQTIAGKTYSEMLTDVDSNNAFTPVYWDSAFAGKVLEARGD